MKKSRILAALTAAILVAGILGGCGKGDKNESDNTPNKSEQSDNGGGSAVAKTITVSSWIPLGEDSTYYNGYNDNPVAKFIEDNYTFDGKKVHFDYYVAPVGGQSDNFNMLLSTGEYRDILDLAMSTTTANELFDDGLVYDLTELVPKYMPNYMRYVEANPELKESIYAQIGDEKKIVTLYGYADGIAPNFAGFCYRRDWIAKYGANPKTGEAFTYGFADANDPYSWSDNVVFPNGTDEPLYISDWEWMFAIFQKAFGDLGIKDGYGFSPYFQGYMITGDLQSAFGGESCSYWYRTADNKCVFGTQTDEFRAYLTCMNTWFNNGWLDKSFDQHNGDIFYSVDAAKVFSGKVGLWQGLQSTVGTQIDAGDGGFTAGAVVYGCRQPINDIYGGESAKGKTPRAMFQSTRLGSPIVLTKKIAEADLPAVLGYFDFLFSDEGVALRMGLTKENYEKSQDAFYKKWNLTDGLYRVDGNTIVYNVPQSDPLAKAASLARPFNLAKIQNVDYGYDRYVAQAVAAWDYYANEPSLYVAAVLNMTPVEDNAVISKVRTNVDGFLQRIVSGIIKGEYYDVRDDASWEQFKKDVGKYQPEKATALWQKALDLLSE